MAEPLSFSLGPEQTLKAALQRVALALDAAGLAEPRREARYTLMAALGLSAARLLLEADRPLGAAHTRATEVCRRRIAREPLARIIGRKEFFGLEFALSDDTLVPRPDTEILVEAMLDHARQRGFDRGPVSVVDLGTGSGAILAAVLCALPQARGIGVDLSAGALATAEANVRRLCGAGRAAFLTGDWLRGLDGPFEVIVSNPPYIETGDLAGLDPEVVRHDPVLALDGGIDGLAAYRRIVAQAPQRLRAGGLLALELGAGQDHAVSVLCREAGLDILECRKDLAGTGRALITIKAE